MRRSFLLFFYLFIAGLAFSQPVTKNGMVASSASTYVSANGAIGASTGVDKNGKIQAALSIGADYQGGKIFYFFVSGDIGYVAGETHGLIVSATDMTATWGCQGSSIANTKEEIGYGKANTDSIIKGCATAGIMARVCADLVLNSYSDWYLPSANELVQLSINNALIGGFGGSSYASSTQSLTAGFSEKNFMISVFFMNNSKGTSIGKGSTAYFRPIRSF